MSGAEQCNALASAHGRSVSVKPLAKLSKRSLTESQATHFNLFALIPHLLALFWQVCKAGLPFADSFQIDHIYPLVRGYFLVSILPIVIISN